MALVEPVPGPEEVLPFARDVTVLWDKGSFMFQILAVESPDLENIKIMLSSILIMQIT